MSGQIGAVYTGLYSKLSGGTALTTLLGGTFIYNKLAPEDANLPYIVYNHVSGGRENITPSESYDDIYFIRAYASTDAAARALDAAVDTLLTGHTLTVTGHTNYLTWREDSLDAIELPANASPIYMAGAYYRIKTDA